MKILDLHCHTDASDGELSPATLWQRAIERQIDVIAITDHDTTAGVRSLMARAAEDVVSGPELVPGVEISATDSGHVVHVVGLWLDPHSDALESFLGRQQSARDERAIAISKKLESKGLPETYTAVRELAAGSPLGRPHFARHLTELGITPNVGAAFKRWLGKGKPGDIDIAWPSLAAAIQHIQAAGGLAVLAHPSKYFSGFSKCYELCQRFKELGGDAMEVVNGAQTVKVTRDLAKIAERVGLAASTGSDFHSPAQTWCDLGSQPGLPEALTPVWQLR